MKRTNNLRKTSYTPQCPQEEFIVPLLKFEIERNINLILQNNRINRVLDVGAGSMPFKEMFISLGIEYYSLDPNPNQNPDFVGEIDGDISEIFEANGTYDLIICTEVLEHVAVWDNAFKNFHNLLNENGKILMSAPHFYSLHEEPFDFWRPTPHAFAYFANRNNLKIENTELIGTFWDMLGTLMANTPRIYIKHEKISLLNKIYVRIINIIFSIIYNRLKSRFFENNFTATCYMYQSNIVTLSK
jgi:SAM-dependent methyltransferase